jgi:malonate transporter
MQQILPVTFPFFGLVLCGYVVSRARLLPLQAIPGLNIFVLYFALPCLLYRFAASTPIVRLLDPGVVGVYLLSALLMVALAVAATRRGATGWNDAAFGALVAAFPNSGFMGVPLLVALLGQPAAAPSIVALALDLVVTSSLCIALSRLDHADEHGTAAAVRQALAGMAKNPLPWSIALGCLTSATGFEWWEPARRTVYMLADGATPVALFTIGAVLARAHLAAASSGMPAKIGDLPLVAVLKLFVHPGLVLALGRLAQRAGVPLDDFSLVVLVLVAALPSASNVPILAERYGADSARIARIVLLTTLGAFLSFSGAVALLR